jgi:hypothetical protein
MEPGVSLPRSLSETIISPTLRLPVERLSLENRKVAIALARSAVRDAPFAD